MIVDKFAIIKGKRILVDDLPRKSNVMLKYKCDNCGEIGTRKAVLLFKSKYDSCCTECRSKLKTRLAIDNITDRLNIKCFESFLYDLYIVQMKSISEINDILFNKNTDNKKIVREYLVSYNIPLRHGSEAIKTQYVGAKKEFRRKITLKKCVPIMNNYENRNKLKRTMQTSQYKKKQRISKLGEKNGMYGVTGENNPMWNPNKTREQRQKDRKLNENAKWRKDVFERDDYTCRCCKVKGGKIVAHHLDGYNWCVERRFDIDNGVTLCEECHKKFHRKYGMKDNTIKQFEEYLALI